MSSAPYVCVNASRVAFHQIRLITWLFCFSNKHSLTTLPLSSNIFNFILKLKLTLLFLILYLKLKLFNYLTYVSKAFQPSNIKCLHYISYKSHENRAEIVVAAKELEEISSLKMLWIFDRKKRFLLSWHNIILIED